MVYFGWPRCLIQSPPSRVRHESIKHWLAEVAGMALNAFCYATHVQQNARSGFVYRIHPGAARSPPRIAYIQAQHRSKSYMQPFTTCIYLANCTQCGVQCARTRVLERVRACVRACARACVCACYVYNASAHVFKVVRVCKLSS